MSRHEFNELAALYNKWYKGKIIMGKEERERLAETILNQCDKYKLSIATVRKQADWITRFHRLKQVI